MKEKACRDCKHFIPVGHMCRHPEAWGDENLDPVTGVYVSVSFTPATWARAVTGHCKKEARHFELASWPVRLFRGLDPC